MSVPPLFPMFREPDTTAEFPTAPTARPVDDDEGRSDESTTRTPPNALDVADLLLERVTKQQPTVLRADVVAAWCVLYPEDDYLRRKPATGRTVGTVAAVHVYRGLLMLEKRGLVRRNHPTPGEPDPTVTVLDFAALTEFAAHSPVYAPRTTVRANDAHR